MAGQPKTPFYFVMALVVAGLVAFAIYRADIIAAHFTATRARSGLHAAQIEQAQLKVSTSYLDAGLKELKRRYGSIGGYLTRGLKLSAATISTLRARLVA